MLPARIGFFQGVKVTYFPLNILRSLEAGLPISWTKLMHPGKSTARNRSRENDFPSRLCLPHACSATFGQHSTRHQRGASKDIREVGHRIQAGFPGVAGHPPWMGPSPENPLRKPRNSLRPPLAHPTPRDPPGHQGPAYHLPPQDHLPKAPMRMPPGPPFRGPVRVPGDHPRKFNIRLNHPDPQA